MAASLLDSLAKNENIKGVAIDTETNGEDVRDGRGYLIGISIAWNDTGGKYALYLPFRHLAGTNYTFGSFRQSLQTILDTKRVIFHNAKFDLVSLTTIGLDTSKTRFFDTMILSHLVNENLFSYNLDAVCKHFLGKAGKAKSKQQKVIEDSLGWAYVPVELMVSYATTDALSTLELYEKLIPMLAAEDLGPVWEHKEKFTRLLMKMEGRGVRIDQDLARQEAEKGQGIMLDIIDQLRGRNPASPKDLKFLLIDTLKLPPIYRKRKRKNGTFETTMTFDKEAMEEYDLILEKINNPLAKTILTYRGWSKAVSASYNSYLNLVSPDGRLRCNYKMHGTKTGRMSCEKPNLQQIPKETGKPWNENMRKVFLGSEGSTLLSIDYSQLELRLAAGIAGEDSLKEIFIEGRDLFSEMAASLGMPRSDAKTMTYAIQYGAGVKKIADSLGMSPIEAKKRIDNYYETYPNFNKAKQLVSELTRKNGKVKFWSGRYRHFDNPKKQDYKAFNSLIQGSAADVVEKVMLRLDESGFNEGPCRMLLQVHDEVAFDIQDDTLEEIVPDIKDCMSDVTSAAGVDFGVKFDVSEKAWH